MAYAIFNPNHLPTNELPIIFGFVDGHFGSDIIGQLLAEDGVALGSHISSHEVYALGDLGINEGSRPDRHEIFQKHYPNGYRMEWLDNPRDEPKFIAALALNKKMQKTQ